MPQCNVLRVNAVEEQEEYREAVAEILRRIQSERKLTLVDIADRIDVSLGTISNAANKKADLNSIYLKRLGKVFGGYVLDPYHALYGVRGQPLETDGAADVLPLLAGATHLIARARDRSSPGGATETLSEQLDYLPDMLRTHRELGAHICAIEARKARS